MFEEILLSDEKFLQSPLALTLENSKTLARNGDITHLDKVPLEIKISVGSAGCEVFKKKSDAAYIKVNDKHIFKKCTRGLNVAIIDGYTGTLKNFSIFDTYIESNDSSALIDFIQKNYNSLDKDILSIIVADEATWHLTSDAKQYLNSLGSKEIYSLGYRDAWCFVARGKKVLFEERSTDSVLESNSKNSRGNTAIERVVSAKIQLPDENDLIRIFSNTYIETLKLRYDHLSIEEIFCCNRNENSENLINKEILNCIESSKDFASIVEILLKPLEKHIRSNEIMDKFKAIEEYFNKCQKCNVVSLKDIKQTIFNFTPVYFNQLVMLREKVIKSFENYEKNVVNMISEYDSLQKRSNINLNAYLEEIKSILEVGKNNYPYEKAREVYKNLAIFFNNNFPEKSAFVAPFLKLLNDDTINHQSYLWDHLVSLNSILKQYVEPCVIKTAAENGFQLIEIAASSVTLSYILQKLKNCSINPGDEIRIIASQNFYYDCDKAKELYPGVSWSLTAPNHIIAPGIEKIIFDTSGLPGESRAVKAADGVGHGACGNDGIDGEPGMSAGHIALIGNEIPEKIQCIAKGGAGGNGQEGGNGRDGQDGIDGQDANKDEISIGSVWHDTHVGLRYIRYGNPGTEGTAGGNSGYGGKGGEGGRGGIIERINLKSEKINRMEDAGGKNGNDGKGGQSGKGGYHGRKGKDLSLVVTWRWAVWNRSCEYKYGYISDRSLKDDWGRWWDPSHPSFLQHENDSLFCSKQENRRAVKGQENTTKSTNGKSAKINPVINKNLVFSGIATHLNAQNVHWQVAQNNKLLSALAKKLNLSYTMQNNTALKSEYIKQNTQKWMSTFQQQINKVKSSCFANESNQHQKIENKQHHVVKDFDDVHKNYTLRNSFFNEFSCEKKDKFSFFEEMENHSNNEVVFKFNSMVKSCEGESIITPQKLLDLILALLDIQEKHQMNISLEYLEQFVATYKNKLAESNFDYENFSTIFYLALELRAETKKEIIESISLKAGQILLKNRLGENSVFDKEIDSLATLSQFYSFHKYLLLQNLLTENFEINSIFWDEKIIKNIYNFNISPSIELLEGIRENFISLIEGEDIENILSCYTDIENFWKIFSKNSGLLKSHEISEDVFNMITNIFLRNGKKQEGNKKIIFYKKYIDWINVYTDSLNIEEIAKCEKELLLISNSCPSLMERVNLVRAGYFVRYEIYRVSQDLEALTSKHEKSEINGNLLKVENFVKMKSDYERLLKYPEKYKKDLQEYLSISTGKLDDEKVEREIFSLQMRYKDFKEEFTLFLNNFSEDHEWIELLSDHEWMILKKYLDTCLSDNLLEKQISLKVQAFLDNEDTRRHYRAFLNQLADTEKLSLTTEDKKRLLDIIKNSIVSNHEENNYIDIYETLEEIKQSYSFQHYWANLGTSPINTENSFEAMLSRLIIDNKGLLTSENFKKFISWQYDPELLNVHEITLEAILEFHQFISQLTSQNEAENQEKNEIYFSFMGLFIENFPNLLGSQDEDIYEYFMLLFSVAHATEVENYIQDIFKDIMDYFNKSIDKTILKGKIRNIFFEIQKEYFGKPNFEKLAALPGCVFDKDKKSSSDFDKIFPIEISNFTQILKLIYSAEARHNDQIVDLLLLFDDLTPITSVLSEYSSDSWEKQLLIEHFIEKYSQSFENIEEIEVVIIRSYLQSTDSRFLKLFHNLFIEDQYNLLNAENGISLSDLQLVSKNNLLKISEYLSCLEYSDKLSDVLLDASLTEWAPILSEALYSKKIENCLSNLSINKKNSEWITYFLNRIRLNLGEDSQDIFNEFFEQIEDKLTKECAGDISQIKNLIKAIYYRQMTFSEAIDIVQSKYSQWEEKIKAIIDKKISTDPRTTDEIIDCMTNRELDSITTLSTDVIMRVSNLAKEIYDQIEIEKSSSVKFSERIKGFRNNLEYQKNKQAYVKTHSKEVVLLIALAWWEATNREQLPYTTQLVALLIFLESGEDSGLLQQLRTGEGKTLIVGMLAAVKALSGQAVDIVTSNRDLAKEGCEKMSPFFKKLKLEASINCAQDDEANKQAYLANIVYGEVSAFEGHILHDKYQHEDIFKERYQNREKCLIVDEVDSMLLDNCKSMLYLSHDIQALKSTESLFTFIWAAVLGEDESSYENFDEAVESVKLGIKAYIETKEINISEYLKNFCNAKLTYWIKSAFQAKQMQHDDHFILEKDKDTKEHRIVVMDKKTGVELYSVKWSHGLAQFLELKYRRPLTPESLKAVFISNKKFFSRYGSNLFGLTGTLGAENSRNILRNLYNVSFANIPSSRPVRFKNLEGKVACTVEGWKKLISNEIKERYHNQPILIICDSIEEAKSLREYLEKLKDSLKMENSPCSLNLRKYYKDKHSVNGNFFPGDIIIATNKGGRGTDIAVNNDSGLHVILGYIPESSRIEDQALGRVSRNGQNGSGRLIVKVEEDYAKEYLEPESDLEKLVDFSDIIIEKMKYKRDLQEEETLRELIEIFLNQVDAEEEVFSLFNEFKKNTLNKSSYFLSTTSDEIKKILEEILNNRFAFWLDESTYEREQINSAETRDNFIEKFKTIFIGKERQRILESQNDPDKFFEFPEDFIRIGQCYFKAENYREAEKYFNLGIEKGDITGFAALASACCHVKLGGSNMKKIVRRRLKLAYRKLEDMKQNLMSNGQIIDSLIKITNISQILSDKENRYGDQIKGKLEVVGTHLHYIEKYIGTSLDKHHFTDVAEKIDEKKSEEIYEFLINKGFIEDDIVIRAWGAAQEKKKIKKLLESDIDSSVLKNLYKILDDAHSERKRITARDLENIVNSADELCEILKEKGIIEKFNNFQQKSVSQIWKEIMGTVDLGEKYNSVCISSEQGKISLKEHIANLLENLAVEKNPLTLEALSQHTFDSKSKESEKLYAFLKSHHILKRGGLHKKYKLQSDTVLKEEVEKNLASSPYASQSRIISGKLRGLKGEIRDFKDSFGATFKGFEELEEQDVPSELSFFTGLGLDRFLILEEEISWWNWDAFACAMIGLAQMIAGLALVVLTGGAAAQLGNMLIAEGINDLVYATMAGISGSFSWEAWGIQKAISLAISVATFGVGKLATLGKTVEKASKIGQISRTSIFMRTATKAAADFGVRVGANIATDRALEMVKSGILNKILDSFEANILNNLESSLKESLEKLKAQQGEKFNTALESVIEKAKRAMSDDAQLFQQADTIMSHATTAIQKALGNIAAGLGKSSGIAKALGTTIQIIDFVTNMYDSVEPIIRASTATQVYVSHISHVLDETLDKTDNKQVNCDADAQPALKKLVAAIKQEMSDKIEEALRGPFQRMFTSTMRKAGESLNNTRKNLGNNRKSNAEQLQDLKGKTSPVKLSLLRDYKDVKLKTKRPKKTQETKNKLKREIVQPKKAFHSPVRSAKPSQPATNKMRKSQLKKPSFKKQQKTEYEYKRKLAQQGAGTEQLYTLAQHNRCRYQVLDLQGNPTSSKSGGPQNGIFSPKEKAKKTTRIVQFSKNSNKPIGHFDPCVDVDGKVKAVKVPMDKMPKNSCAAIADVFHDNYENLKHIKDPSKRIEEAKKQTTPERVNKKINDMHKTLAKNSYLIGMQKVGVNEMTNDFMGGSKRFARCNSTSIFSKRGKLSQGRSDVCPHPALLGAISRKKYNIRTQTAKLSKVNDKSSHTGSSTNQKVREAVNSPTAQIPDVIKNELTYKSNDGTTKTRYIAVQNPIYTGDLNFGNKPWHAGHVVAQQNGGSGVEISNIFPQNPECNVSPNNGQRYTLFYSPCKRQDNKAPNSWRRFEDKINRKKEKYGDVQQTTSLYYQSQVY